MYICICVCVCVYVYIYIYIYISLQIKAGLSSLSVNVIVVVYRMARSSNPNLVMSAITRDVSRKFCRRDTVIASTPRSIAPY